MKETYLQKQDAIDANCVLSQVNNGNIGSLRDDANYLRYLVVNGAKQKYGEITTDLQKQIDYELKVINDLGFNSYFLIVWDLIKSARENNIPIGPGRGSVGGSVVAYALDITRFDPIEYDLIFERFLNPERPEMPDIDIDVSQYRRQELIQIVIDKYGVDHVAQIITYQTLARRSLIEAVGKVMRIGWTEIDTIKGFLPEDEENDDSTLAEIIADRPKLREYMNSLLLKFPEFWNVCLTLEGLHRAESKHAGGVIVCDTPLAEIVPLFTKGKKDAAESDAAHPAIQLDMKDAEKIGLLKMDLLGLRTLSVIDEAVTNIRKNNPSFTIDDLTFDDPDVYKMLRDGRTKSVFQLEGQGITSVVKRMHVSTFNDLIALLALYRPGPLDAKMDTAYINRKLGKEEVTYLLPELEPILKPTWGIILYQEQVMRMAMVLAGYSAAEADKLRKAMGKKDKELMALEMSKFTEKAVAKGYAAHIVSEIAHQIETFARYGFNKSHSTAYAINTYHTAYLKCHYPFEYMAAEMNSFLGKNDKLASVISEVKSMGLPLLPPHINHSKLGFSVDHFAIRFGLSGIKGVGTKTVQAILEERENGGDFTSLFDFCDRIKPKDCNSAAKKLLVLSGAFDEFGDRAIMVHEINKMYTKKYNELDTSIKLMTIEDKLEHEKELLNFYVSGTPFSTSLDSINRFGAAMQFDKLVDFGNGIAGLLKAYREMQSARGQMAFLTIEAENGLFDVTVFSDTYKRYNNIIKEAKDKMVVVRGKYNEYRGKSGVVMDDIALINRDYIMCNSITIDVGKNPSLMTLAAIRHECSCSPGNAEVNIIVSTGEEEVEISTECRVLASMSLIKEIESIIGFGKIKCGW